MSENLVLIKFGGSLITNKSEKCSAKLEIIDKLSYTISEILNMGKKVIIVHGAGGYGHIKAKKWRISEGKILEIIDDQYKAIVEIRNDMEILNKLIISRLASYSIDAKSYSPHKNGIGLGLDYTLDEEFFRTTSVDYVPVTYGDVVDSNTEKEFGILSGDDLCEIICNVFKPSHVIFTMDGALGLIDDPSLPNGGNLIREFYPNNQEIVTTKIPNDVTGGMSLKLKRAINCHKTGARVSIINGNNVEMILKAISGEEYVGTEFLN
tara:strand:- start:7793 stop:8587 length:795 start_codon:yes stop_codon:yes gene_type:complete